MTVRVRVRRSLHIFSIFRFGIELCNQKLLNHCNFLIALPLSHTLSLESFLLFFCVQTLKDVRVKCGKRSDVLGRPWSDRYQRGRGGVRLPFVKVSILLCDRSLGAAHKLLGSLILDLTIMSFVAFLENSSICYFLRNAPNSLR